MKYQGAQSMPRAQQRHGMQPKILMDPLSCAA